MPDASETSAPAPANPDPAPVASTAIVQSTAPNHPAPAASKTFTQEEVSRLLGERAQRAAEGARAQFLSTFKDFGVGSADDLASLVRGAYAAKQAEMTELQKAQERTKQLETDLARAKADAAATQESMRRTKVFRESSVAPEYEEVMGVLLDKAKADQPEAFDERTWLESIKAQRPLLFATAPATVPPTQPSAPAPVGATTGVVYPKPPAVVTPPAPANAFDARQATVADLRAWEQSMGIAIPSGGRL